MKKSVVFLSVWCVLLAGAAFPLAAAGEEEPPPPVVSHADGIHPIDGDVPVTITASPGAGIVYTVDGTLPSLEHGTRVDEEKVDIILRNGETVVKAIAVGHSGESSEVAESAIERERPKPAKRKPVATSTAGDAGTWRGKAAPPAIRSGGGTPSPVPAAPRAKREPKSYHGSTSGTGGGAGAGAGMGGGMPGRITLPGASQQQVARPSIQPNGGNYAQGARVTARISCATPGATIIYTTNGTIPSNSNGTRMVSGQSITLPNRNATVKAIAIKDGMRPSSVASALFSRAVLKKP